MKVTIKGGAPSRKQFGKSSASSLIPRSISESKMSGFTWSTSEFNLERSPPALAWYSHGENDHRRDHGVHPPWLMNDVLVDSNVILDVFTDDPV